MLVRGTKEELETLKTYLMMGMLKHNEESAEELKCYMTDTFEEDADLNKCCDKCILNCREINKHLDDLGLFEISIFNEKEVTVEVL